MNNTSIIAVGSSSRSAITATVGYMCVALSAWMISMTTAGWFATVFARGSTLLMPLAIILTIMGILAFLSERTLDAVIFFGGAGLFWGDQGYFAALGAGAAQAPHYNGWYDCLWAVFFFYVWLGSFKTDTLRMVFLLAAWLTLLALAVGAWATLHSVTVIGGYLGLLTAILAALVSASAIIGHGADTPAIESARAPYAR